MAYYIYTAPHYAILEKKNSRPIILILAAYEITPATISKHVFQDSTHEEVYIRIFLLTVNT